MQQTRWAVGKKLTKSVLRDVSERGGLVKIVGRGQFGRRVVRRQKLENLTMTGKLRKKK